jgi:GNAT superfamily N-acetyltransferase
LNFEFLVDRQEAIPIVARWYFDEWGHNNPSNSIPQTIERISGKLNRDRTPLHLLAMEDEQVLGVAQLKLHEMDIYPEKEFWLGSLFVSPTSRGKGVGSAIANKIATIAEGFGAEQLYLQTEVLDGGLYRDIGWNLVEIVVYKDVHVAVMARQI